MVQVKRSVTSKECESPAQPLEMIAIAVVSAPKKQGQMLSDSWFFDQRLENCSMLSFSTLPCMTIHVRHLLEPSAFRENLIVRMRNAECIRFSHIMK